MSISNTIKRLRAETGYSQAELAQLIGVDRSAVAQWENRLSEPKMGNVRKLAQVFGVKVSELLDDGTSETPRSFVRMHAPSNANATPCVEVPASVLDNHPNAVAVPIADDSMSRVIPHGMVALADPDLTPSNGSIVAMEVEGGQVLVRRWYRGASPTMLVADSHEAHDDVLLGPDASARLIGTVFWAQTRCELEG